jgi:hypothetical protein
LHPVFQSLFPRAPGLLVRPRQADQRRQVPGMPDGPVNGDARQIRVKAFEQALNAENALQERFCSWEGQFCHGSDVVTFMDRYEAAAGMVPSSPVRTRGTSFNQTDSLLAAG